MVPLLPKVDGRGSSALSLGTGVPLAPGEPAGAGADSLLNKFLVKNDLKFLENYLLLLDSCEPQPAGQLDAAFANTALALLQPQAVVSPTIASTTTTAAVGGGGASPQKGLSKLAALSFRDKTAHEAVVWEIQQQAAQPAAALSALDAQDNSYTRDDDGEPGIEAFARSSDLLLYYKVFIYLLWAAEDAAGSSALVDKLAAAYAAFADLFDQLVHFSSTDDNSNDNGLDYGSLAADPRHLDLAGRYQNAGGSAAKSQPPENELLLIHFILRRYDTLTYRNLNYLMYVMDGRKPANIAINSDNTPGSCAEHGAPDEAYKKLRSCSRCRKNKIKCDSAAKFGYSCSNCFKKNINFLRVYLKKLSSQIEDDVEEKRENPRDCIKMARSSSNMTNVSTSTTTSRDSMTLSMSHDSVALSPVSSVSSAMSVSPALLATKHNQALVSDNACDCGAAGGANGGCLLSLSRNNSFTAAGTQAQSSYNNMSSLSLFLHLFQISPEQLQGAASGLPDGSAADVDMESARIFGASEIITCQVQLVLSNLMLKKKSMKKINLIKTLKQDICDMKKQVDEMVLKEEQLIQQLLYGESGDSEHGVSLPAPNYSNQEALSTYCHSKREFDSSLSSANKRALSSLSEEPLPKKPKSMLTTNDLLVLNGFKPVLQQPFSARKKSFYDYLEKKLEAQHREKAARDPDSKDAVADFHDTEDDEHGEPFILDRLVVPLVDY